jgi:hypothetical protein
MAMDLNDIESKKPRIFLSYSSEDKEIAGIFKTKLEGFDFVCFLAHDDIEPLDDWLEVIKDNLKMCEIFILLITKNFKKSDWTDQETGWALATDKFIIPLQVDLPPYGFINPKQGLLVKRAMLENQNYNEKDTYILNISHKIFKLISEKNPTLKSKIDNYDLLKIIKLLSISTNFDNANSSALLLEKYHDFTADQVQLLFQVTKENSQIQGAFGAQRIIKNIFRNHKESLKKEEYDEAIKLLSG